MQRVNGHLRQFCYDDYDLISTVYCIVFLGGPELLLRCARGPWPTYVKKRHPRPGLFTPKPLLPRTGPRQLQESRIILLVLHCEDVAGNATASIDFWGLWPKHATPLWDNEFDERAFRKTRCQTRSCLFVSAVVMCWASFCARIDWLWLSNFLSFFSKLT